MNGDAHIRHTFNDIYPAMKRPRSPLDDDSIRCGHDEVGRRVGGAALLMRSGRSAGSLVTVELAAPSTDPKTQRRSRPRTSPHVPVHVW